MGPELIGRQHPAAVLRAETARAAASHGGLVLVTGEAGIGKTSLVTKAAEEARAHGALVVGGACWDSRSAPGYWPWTQILRALRRAATPEEWAAAERECGGCLPALLGETRGPADTGPAEAAPAGVGAVPTDTAVDAPCFAPGGDGAPVDGEADSFRLHDAVTGALVAVSQSRPLVVIIDDLHWADPASLRLLEFAAQHTWFERLLFIGTYRDVELEAPGHPLRPLMLPLLTRATALTLTGLGPEETAALLERTTGMAPGEALVREAHARTGGNPFFIEQTARLWHGGGAVSAMAPGVRDALRRRLSQLPEPVERLLSTASVLGRAFHRQWLAAVAGTPVPQTDRLLDQAVAARLVTTEGGGRFAFAHDLVREALYEALGPEEAARRHAAAVRAADRSPAPGSYALPAELAQHAYLADGVLERDRVVELLEAAAADAGVRFAYEESIGHRRRALERCRPDDSRKRVLLGLDLGEELHHCGHQDEAWTVFEQAVAEARALDEPELLARAALTLYRVDNLPRGSALTDGLLHEAHARLDPDEPAPTGASQLALLDQLAQDLAARLAALARGTADDESLSFGLWARHDAIWGPGTAAEREALTGEMASLARRADDPVAEAVASSLRWVALLEQGDPGYLDQFRDMAATALRSGQPRCALMVDIDRCILALHRGRFAEAGELLEKVAKNVADSPEQYGFILHHLRWQLLLAQGRFPELEELHEDGIHHDYPHPRLLEATTAVSRGDADGIRTALTYVTQALASGTEFSRGIRAMWDRLLAQTAAATGKPDLIQHAREALAPNQGQWAVSLYGCDVGGPFALWTARLDAAEERWDDAVTHFTEARESADLLRLRVWSLEARAGLAAALLGRRAPDDAARAATLAERVEREAAALGMRHLAITSSHVRTHAQAHLSAASSASPTHDAPTAVAAAGVSVAVAGGSEGRTAGVSAEVDTDVSAGDGTATVASDRGGRTDTTPGSEAPSGSLPPAEPPAPQDTEQCNEPAPGPASPRPDAAHTSPAPSPRTLEEPGSVTAAPPPERPASAALGAERGDAITDTTSTPHSPAEPTGDEHGSATTAPAEPREPVTPSPNEFRREGAVWRLGYSGRVVHMPDAKGLRDIHFLLSQPGADIPAARLLNPDGGEEIAAAHAMGGDAMLDDAAKASYKRRLEALDQEIDGAAARGDTDRVAEYDREREALLTELRAAAGLAGRTRRLGDQAERTRKTVTARIRGTLRKLDERHPELAAHLRATLSTGATCRYQLRPQSPTIWRL